MNQEDLEELENLAYMLSHGPSSKEQMLMYLQRVYDMGLEEGKQQRE